MSYAYAKQLKAAGPPYPPLVDEVLPNHDAHWKTEEVMAGGCPALALEKGERSSRHPDDHRVRAQADPVNDPGTPARRLDIGPVPASP